MVSTSDIEVTSSILLEKEEGTLLLSGSIDHKGFERLTCQYCSYGSLNSEDSNTFHYQYNTYGSEHYNYSLEGLEQPWIYASNQEIVILGELKSEDRSYRNYVTKTFSGSSSLSYTRARGTIKEFVGNSTYYILHKASHNLTPFTIDFTAPRIPENITEYRDYSHTISIFKSAVINNGNLYLVEKNVIYHVIPDEDQRPYFWQTKLTLVEYNLKTKQVSRYPFFKDRQDHNQYWNQVGIKDMEFSQKGKKVDIYLNYWNTSHSDVQTYEFDLSQRSISRREHLIDESNWIFPIGKDWVAIDHEGGNDGFNQHTVIKQLGTNHRLVLDNMLWVRAFHLSDWFLTLSINWNGQFTGLFTVELFEDIRIINHYRFQTPGHTIRPIRVYTLNATHIGAIYMSFDNFSNYYSIIAVPTGNPLATTQGDIPMQSSLQTNPSTTKKSAPLLTIEYPLGLTPIVLFLASLSYTIKKRRSHSGIKEYFH